MEYIRLRHPEHGVLLDPQPYIDALPEIARELPPGARAFAEDADHYDFYSERCIKDLNVRSIACHDRNEQGLQLVLELQFNDLGVADRLTLTYDGVRSLRLDTEDEKPVGETRLGDLLLDEVLPHPLGMSHELAFHGGRIVVTAADLQAVWLPPD